MTASPNKNRPKANDGFILVSTLWILGLLSVLISISALYATNSAAGLAPYHDRLNADALFSAAVELAAGRLHAESARSRTSLGHFAFRIGRARIDVEHRSERARIDLNAASQELLTGLFVTLGEKPDDADGFAAGIVEWRKPTSRNSLSPTSANASLGEYQSGRKFSHARELSLVSGMPIQLASRALPYVTVYSGEQQVNILAAEPEVIASLPGMTQDRLAAVLRQQKPPNVDGSLLLNLLGPARRYAALDPGKAFRILVRISFDNGRTANAEVAIVVYEGVSEPYSVMSWQDDHDSPRGLRRGS